MVDIEVGTEVEVETGVEIETEAEAEGESGVEVEVEVETEIEVEVQGETDGRFLRRRPELTPLPALRAAPLVGAAHLHMPRSTPMVLLSHQSGVLEVLRQYLRAWG